MRRLSQREAIAQAYGAYIIPISHSKFQVYLLGKNGLELLYPDAENLKQDRLHYQRVQVTDPSKPISCFMLGGGGYSKTQELRDELRKYNSDLQVKVLQMGFSVDPIRAKPVTRHIDEFESGMYPKGGVDREKFRMYSVEDEDAEIRLDRDEDGTFTIVASGLELKENALPDMLAARSWEDAERIANKLVAQALHTVSVQAYAGELHP